MICWSDGTTKEIPSQNGIIKRNNRHLLKTAQELLFQMKVPKRFWAMWSLLLVFKLIVCHQICLLVMCLTMFFFQISHYFWWKWGIWSTCYVGDVPPAITKLDPNVLKCIFLGYFRVQLVYQCYSIELKKIYCNNWCGIFIDHHSFMHLPCLQFNKRKMND